MKKGLKIIGIILVVFFLVLLIAPFFLKGKIVELIKTEANNNLNAKLEFSDVSLSLLSNFPKLAVGIEDFSIVGIEDFEGDTLVRMESLDLSVDVMSVIKGTKVDIHSIDLKKPLVNILIHEDGKGNYDIAKVSEEPSSTDDTVDPESAPLKLDIKSYSISNGTFIYNDQSLKMKMVLLNLNHTGSGNFGEDIFTLSTFSDIGDVYVDYEGTTYIRNMHANLKADLAMDIANMKFEFMENELILNNLLLEFDGWLAMPEEDIDMDIKFSSTNNDLKGLLSLIPSEFTEDMEGVEASGNIGFGGYVKGTYNDNLIPAYGIDIFVDQGRVQYPDLPKPVQNIQVHSNIVAPGGEKADALAILIPKFYMEFGSKENSVDAHMAFTDPLSELKLDTRIDIELDLASFADAIPLKGVQELKGDISTHILLQGAMSDIENQRFDKFNAEGRVGIEGLIYADSLYRVEISKAQASIKPSKMDISAFQMNYDGMNISANGFIDNYIQYALLDTTLHGRFSLEIDEIDVDKYMAQYSMDTNGDLAVDSSSVESVDPSSILVPDNLDIELNANVGKISYDGLIIDNITAKVKVRDEIASIKDLSCNLLEGSLLLNGDYNTQIHSSPTASFSYDLKNIDINKAATTIDLIQEYAPIAKQAKGRVSSKFNLTTELTPSLDPVYESMNGKGKIQTQGVVLEGGKFLEKLSNTLKSPGLKRQEVENINASFTIEDGKITTQPFDVKINDMSANISGYSTVEQQMDYLMKMKVPRDALGGEFNDMAEGLLAQANAFLGGNMSLGEFINVDLKIQGDISDPKITPQFAGMEGGDSVKEVLKDKIEEEVDKAKDDAIAEAQKQADKLLADAQKEADRIVKEAQKAGQKLREEADKQAKKLVDDAKNPFAKQGAKIAGEQLVKEADKSAKKLEAEAQEKADKIMERAQREADDLIEKAKSK